MVDEYQDTNRPQYLLDQAPRRAVSQPRASSAIRTSPSTSGAAPISRTSSTSSTTSPKRRSSSSSRTTARRRSFSTPRRRSSARTATARTSGSGPTRRAARASSISAATTSSRKRTSSPARSSRRARPNVDSMVAILYRTNAQSRAIEDSLMRESIPYKIIGGVRFYERKEIKDALAYLKLIINPHDDVSLRRVINVPARGIGKGVMDSLQAIEPGRRRRRRAAAAGGRSAGSRSRRGRCGRVCSTPSTKASSATAPSPRCAPSAISSPAWPMPPARTPVSILIGKMLDRTRLSQRSARREQRRGQRAHREPDGAGLGRARFRDARARAVARRLRRSAVAPVRSRRGIRQARREGLDDDHARGQGARVPDGDHRRAGRRPVSRTRDRRKTTTSSKRSAACATSA